MLKSISLSLVFVLLSSCGGSVSSGGGSTPLGNGVEFDSVLSAGDKAGSSVAIEGAVVVVGAPGDTGDEGALYVFRENSAGVFEEEAKLKSSDIGAGDNFGLTVALSPNLIAVGAPGHNSGSGAVYLFRYSSGAWVEEEKLEASDGAAGDAFGKSLALDVSLLAVGAPDKNSSEGKAYVFEYASALWAEVADFSATTAVGGGEFAADLAVDLSNNRVAVGNGGESVAPHSFAGAVYIFEKNPTWSFQQKFTPAAATTGTRFGFALDIGVDRVVAASPNNESAYVFEFDGTSWNETATLAPADNVSGDRFGEKIRVLADSVLIGTPFRDEDSMLDSGKAYLFEYDGSSWSEVDDYIDQTTIAGAGLATSIDLSAGHVILGAPMADGTKGAFYIF